MEIMGHVKEQEEEKRGRNTKGTFREVLKESEKNGKKARKKKHKRRER